MNIHARRVLAYVVLILVTIMCLFWFYILFVNATRSKSDLNKGFTMIPGTAMAKNLYNLFHNSNLPIIRGLLNSLIVSLCTAALSTYFSTMTAFAIHAYDFKLKKFMFTFILAIMMIPTQVTALGFLNLLRKIKLMDSFIPLIVPAIAAPAVFFYMKQYMEANIPLDLMESARIDGAGEFLIYNKIAFPLMKPAIAVQAIFSFVTSWNNYFTPALVLKSDTKKTLPILIATLRSADFLKFDMGQVYMFIAMSILPVIVVYVFMAKNIVAGMTVGAVKG
ncbi:MAG: carbohydrate ABC transporter permease [Eubacterium sp.]|nr:carbohydrate ABC transporter permease [Eubacterium sp.]MEE3399112.1 carbohydrate ABC transporter permease [Eubacterium sp.]